MADLKAPTLEVKKASKKEVSRERKTIRLEVKLFEPTKDSFPRYNVRELKEKFLKENYGGDTGTPNKLPTLDESVSASGPSFSDHDNDDVARLAKKFEAKYGTGYEISDKGAGYDETDSFIDNTEAFDETLVKDTPCGGFYINSGPLKFDEKREIVSGGGANGSKEKSGGTKKRSNESWSSVESDEDEETPEKAKKPKKNKLKKQKRKELVEQKPCKEIAIKDMLRFQRDSLLKAKTESPKHNRNRIVSDDDEESEASIALSESSNDSDVKFIDAPIVSCPSGLPDDFVKKIDEFNSISDGKTSDQILVNSQLYQILVEIEGSKVLTIDQKISIKTYLSSIVQCQDLYRKIQKERPWDKTTLGSTMEPKTVTEPSQEKPNQGPGQAFATICRLPSID